MPLSFTAASAELFDIFPPGSMSSTHTGNPICCAAALANIDIILNENLTENARRMGDLLHQRLHDLQAKFPDHIASVAGKGLVAGVHCVHPGGISPNGPLAADIVQRCWHKGLLMFNPVGFGGGTVKISPPLVITEAAILESTAVLEEAFAEALVAAPVAT
jgi:4-aminobutyrate aminotransferase/diaminobutyrate-pyruvate transaminase/4-aminobutyrate aminotransferase/(S)-3-amino-2-methylpropionate transaminase